MILIMVTVCVYRPLKLMFNVTEVFLDGIKKTRQMILISCLALLAVQTVQANNQNSNTASNESDISASIAECNQLEDQDPEAAITLALQLLTQIDRKLNPINYGQVLGCLGWSYASQDQHDAAKLQAIQLEHLAQNLEANEDSVHLARRAGSIYHRLGDRVSALENYAQAMKRAEAIRSLSQQIPLLVNLGVLNSELREHESAIENYYQALDLMAETEDFRYQPPVLFNLAATLNGQERFAEGLKIFQQVEAMINEHWPPTRISQVYAGLAAAYSVTNELEIGKEYAEKAMNLLAESDHKFNDYYNVMSTLAAILSKQNDMAAMDYANQVKDYYTDPANKQAILGSTNPLNSLAHTYERLDMLPEAIAMHKLFNQLEQEVQDTFNQQAMAQMQARLNDSKSRAELAQLKSAKAIDDIKLQEAAYNRNLLLVIAGSVAFIFLMALWWSNIAKRKLKKMALTDSLTQLGNRRAIQEWITVNKLPEEPACRLLWLIDIDNFKEVNDQFDYDLGDHALQQIASALKVICNKHRVVGRWGGAEFVLISDDVNAEQKDNFSQLLLSTIENTGIKAGKDEINLTASVGVSQILDQDRSTWNKAMYQADKALHTAKSRGRNCVVLATGYYT